MFATISKEIFERLEGVGVDLDIVINIRARNSSGFAESKILTIGKNAAVRPFDEPASLLAGAEIDFTGELALTT